MKKRTYEASNAAKRQICTVLKELMTQKPLNRITVAEIMRGCGMARQHFYYHFDDVYDAVRWIFEEEAVALLREHEGVMLWQDGLLQLFQLAVYCGQPHRISTQPQLFGQSRCTDGLFAALLQTLQYGLLLFGTI